MSKELREKIKAIRKKKDEMEVAANHDSYERDAYNEWLKSPEADLLYRKKRVKLKESTEDGPVHDHDCSHCIFVGQDEPRGANEKLNANVVDMYVHEHPKYSGEHSLIRRFGSEPEKNSSTKMKWADNEEKWNKVIRAYHQKLKEGR